MTFLPVAHVLLSALVSLSPDSTTARPLISPTPVVVAAPAADTLSAFVAAPILTPPVPTPTTPTTVAAPVAAPALAAGGWTFAPGMVRMPEWAVDFKTGLVRAGHADSVVVEKSEHRMTLYSRNEVLGTYLVALGQRQGQKERAGDYKTPVGLYHIDAKNANSHYHLALHVSYPNAEDVARARAVGASTGGDIMIHGLPNGQGAAGITHRNYDWTNGCVAVTDQEIEEIFGAVPVGTPVRIEP